MNLPHLPGNEVADGCEPGGLLGPQRQHVAQGAVQRGEPRDVPLLPPGHDATAARRRVGDPRPDPVSINIVYVSHCFSKIQKFGH